MSGERGNLVIALWGSLGFVALLGQATYRLAPYAQEVIETGMTPLQWALFVGYGLFMAYSEGYRGFHKQASPRVVERSFYLARKPFAVGVLLAPLFAMGLFGATRKRLIVGWAIVLMIVGLVILVRMLDQPWRGIVDGGVVLGLAIGATSTLYFLVRALAGRLPGVDPEVSE